ncbi:unnamed protein product [Vicia faba]|uniref:Uncharacterized protein n=1 Tax=Vicia faba TaxID=3906 RepID=A0AAV1AVQ0_VICFA|nr:unnamed protein product [Vicia faba]
MIQLSSSSSVSSSSRNIISIAAHLRSCFHRFNLTVFPILSPTFQTIKIKQKLQGNEIRTGWSTTICFRIDENDKKIREASIQIEDDESVVEVVLMMIKDSGNSYKEK